MRWQRILSVAAVFLAISGSLLASEREKRLQVRWSELKLLIVGKKATLQLAEGARLEGRVRRVLSGSLDFKVKKSPEPADYPKGPIQIQRETISRIEVRGLKANRAKQVGATVGTLAGTLFGSLALVLTSKKFEGSIPGGAYAAMFGAATGAAALVYRALAPKGVTLIEILPEPPGGGEPKATNKHSTP